MSERLLLSMPAPGETELSWLVWDVHTERAPERGSIAAQPSALAELGQRFSALPCYVVVPGEWVSWQRVVLPKGGRVGLAALPFQLEEQLCSDLDSAHFCCGDIRANEASDVLVVDREYMGRWHELLVGSGLRVKALLPDYAMLPENVVLIDRNRAIARIEGAAVAIARDNFASWWQLSSAPEQVQFFRERGSELPAELASLAGEAASFEHRLEAIAQCFSPWPINLLSGEYALRDERSAELQRLRWPLILLLTVLLGYFAKLALEVHDNRRHIALYEQGMVDIYQDVFPGARVVNARSQMRSQLNALQGGGSENEFLPWLERIARASKGDAGLRIVQLSYDKTVLKVLLEADTYDAVDRWVVALSKQGFSVQRGAFGQQDKGISGQLELREAEQ